MHDVAGVWRTDVQKRLPRQPVGMIGDQVRIRPLDHSDTRVVVDGDDTDGHAGQELASYGAVPERIDCHTLEVSRDFLETCCVNALLSRRFDCFGC
jgi:hypothetical protein